MQSPSTNSPAPQYQSNGGQAFNLAQPPLGRRPTPVQPGPDSVNSPFGEGSSASLYQNAQSDVSDVIREGKQRAKDVMAASGMDVPSSAMSNAPSTPNTSEGQANGVQMSRKRSRSGTRKLVTTPSASDAPRSQSQKLQSEDAPTREEMLLDRYIQRDSLYAANMNDQSDRARSLLRAKEQEKEWYMNEGRQQRVQNPASVFGYGYAGYGNGRTDDRPRLEYPMHRRPAGSRRTRGLRTSRKDHAQQAEFLEDLVPVRLDIELEKLRLRDTFTWNLNDRLVQPQLFAETLVEDLKLPQESSQQLARQVHQELAEQLQNYYPHAYPPGIPAEPDLPYGAHKNDDMRITIKLNITIGHITLVDQFEWDTNNPLNSPEEFARQMALDLSLSGEFCTAIAHSIREQSQLYTKSLFLTNYEFDGRPIEDPDIRDNMLPTPVPSIFRPHQAQKDWTPYMYELSEMELEKTELSMLREQRAQKRQLNRRGGPALPDLKERQRTVRSLVVSTVIPGAAETLEASGIFKVRRTASGRRGRRGAQLDENSDSDDLEAEDSAPESPGPLQMPSGTARTRGMRGAATAATAAMRLNYGRSQTPDVLAMGLPEARASRRTTGGFEAREDTAEPSSLIVTLRLNPLKYRQWANKRGIGRVAAAPLSGFPTSASLPQPTPLPRHVAKQAPSTPALKNQSLPVSQRNSATPARAQQAASKSTSASGTAQASEKIEYDALGRASASRVPQSQADDTPEQPPPPKWLETAMKDLHDRYPDSSFFPVMRFGVIDADTGNAARVNFKSLPVGSSPTPIPIPNSTEVQRVKFVWVPRIRCTDCVDKLYNALPEDTAAKFEIHLTNNKHRANVMKRLGVSELREGRSSRSGSG